MRPVVVRDRHVDVEPSRAGRAGLTDEAAGARLGISRRTVVRRVQDLMERTGSRSRLQLGWQARERGWL
ncbi:MAG TPA: hypothetical protein VHN18_02960 [Micromonosporaceae bacterium]|nr:hypothetical protein [Micromonosporaceae bacterium]